jgi:hypothetical protein
MYALPIQKFEDSHDYKPGIERKREKQHCTRNLQQVIALFVMTVKMTLHVTIWVNKVIHGDRNPTYSGQDDGFHSDNFN